MLSNYHHDDFVELLKADNYAKVLSQGARALTASTLPSHSILKLISGVKPFPELRQHTLEGFKEGLDARLSRPADFSNQDLARLKHNLAKHPEFDDVLQEKLVAYNIEIGSEIYTDDYNDEVKIITVRRPDQPQVFIARGADVIRYQSVPEYNKGLRQAMDTALHRSLV